MKTPRSWLPPTVLLLIAAGLITAGVLQGDATATLNKAIRICFECIGIG
ncbi:MAG: thioredoxin [Coriobacteriales bacterium]|nr:thioredoxin [Coriobacteriales bacterium]